MTARIGWAASLALMLACAPAVLFFRWLVDGLDGDGWGGELAMESARGALATWFEP